jgi:hypothetical protein
MPIDARYAGPTPGTSDTRSGRRSFGGFSSKCTIRPCLFIFRMPKDPACSAVTGVTATVTSATCRRWLSTNFR